VLKKLRAHQSGRNVSGAWEQFQRVPAQNDRKVRRYEDWGIETEGKDERLDSWFW